LRKKIKSMQSQINILRATRENALKTIDGFSIEELNQIPEGFNNNLIWHLGHMVVTQQLLVYGLSGLPKNVSDEWIAKYRKGTKPEGEVGAEEFEQIKAKMLETIDQMQADFEKGIFKNFKTYPTSYGYTLNSAADAAAFNNVHEAMHLGNLISMKKLV